MNTPQKPINSHKDYHAHVYFDKETLEFASNLCHRAGEKFGLEIGRVHQKNVGPHTKWSCQILFSDQSFDQLVPWLEANRGNLSVLIHANTGDDIKDHTTFAYWLGDAVALNFEAF
ncbi:DOPA 4,5-dioxygenase family protein [Vibrio cionasavignyae]|uniref:DOPA 4,5-dioxygenase family protein n=1 Tax=Vibrio cionasavignyae TaxID=2910252 RepID=UPI003D0F7EEC